MDIKTIKLCPFYEVCPGMQWHNGNPIFADNVEYIWLKPYQCIQRKPGQRKSYICTMRIDLSKITLENALKDVLEHRKKYLKYYYASEVDDFIKRLKEMIKNDGRSSRES